MLYKLSDIFDLQMGKTPSRDNNMYWKGGNLPWVSIADLSKSHIYIENSKEMITSSAAKDTLMKCIPQDTVIMSFKLSLGKTAITRIPLYTNEAIMAFIDKKVISLEPKYIYFLFSNIKWEQYTNSAVKGKTLNKKFFSDFQINIPKYIQQTKIASILIRINKILEYKHCLIKAYDALIKSRFDELIIGDKCDRLMFNDLFFCTTGKLDSNAAIKGGRYPFFTCAKEIFYINDYAFDQEALLLAGNNAAGKYDVKYYNGKFNAYQRTYVLSLRKKGIYSIFKKQLEDKLEYLQSQSKGSTTRYLTMGILKKLTFCVPDMEIQLKLDNEIQQINKLKVDVQKSIDETQLLMNSLMQEYFG